ncbi:hypothetical protein G9A89_020394 [Geosiphon pyriformis]|nr:hypothetical protein G9A89_020394 [Geosiphon pyriformis]
MLAKSKKVANITFSIVTNKVSTQEDLSVIEAARQNVLATFPLKNTSEKLPLAASGSFSSLLAGSSSPVKVFSKRHTWVSPSVVSIISKSPKIFNNRPVNKLVFPALTTTTTSTTTTASQMAAKAKNSKKQQQTVAIAMVTPNLFVIPDEILEKISTAAVSPLPDMDNNSNGTFHKIRKDQPQAVLPNVVLSGRSSPVIIAKQFITPDDLKDWADQMEMESTAPPPVFGTADGGAWKNVNGCQRFFGWVASNLVAGSTFKIKMALLNAVKLFCVEFASQESLNGAIKVAIGKEVFLTTLKIAQSSGMASVSSSPLSVALHDVPLGTSPDNIKAALGIFGVVTSVKLKPAGLWQYTVVHFKNISSAAEALKHWSCQREIIASRDAFKAKLVNLPFGCTAFEISDLVSQETPGCHHCYRCQDLDHLAVDCKVSPPLSPKFSSFTSAKSYAKAVAFVISPAAAAAGIDPVLSGISLLASMESHLNELALLVKSIIEPVGSLVVLVTKLLSISPAVNITLRESVIGLEKQVKAVAAVASMLNRNVKSLTKKCDQISLEDASNNDDMDDENDEGKNFSVYDDIFDMMMQLWEGQPPSIKSNPDQTAKWMSSMVKNSYELVSIMGKMYELDMFDTLSSIGSTSM